MSTALIHCDKVVKNYGLFAAVKALSFDVFPGEIFGLLGPNGAGKSSLIRMIYGASPRTSGTMLVLGYDPMREGAALRSHLGVVPQENCLDEALTLQENLEIFCRYHQLMRRDFEERSATYLKMFSLEEKRHSVIRSLSGGMQRRLAFVRALLCNPKLLILDEPTTGLDPAVRHLLWDKVKELNSQGVTIILCTHYLEEAESLCSKLLILDGGSIVASGSPQQLIQEHQVNHLEDVFLKVSGRRMGVDE